MMIYVAKQFLMCCIYIKTHPLEDLALVGSGSVKEKKKKKNISSMHKVVILMCYSIYHMESEKCNAGTLDAILLMHPDVAHFRES